MNHFYRIFVLLLVVASAGIAAEWKVAQPGWSYEFPRDHGSHPGFKTEWWYFTGTLADSTGRQFGYQLTFFRQGIRVPSEQRKERSRFIVDDMKFGHFALTDLANKRFIHHQKLSRGAFNESGVQANVTGAGKVAWLEDWTLSIDDAGRFVIAGSSPEGRVNLTLEAAKPWVIHGEGGISQKAAGEGRASHYYSGTRLRSQGRVSIDGDEIEVKGESWFDHEWATNQLTAEQIGWEWFSIQLEDGSELMLYQMRRRDGSSDQTSSGTYVVKDGSSQHLRRDDYKLTPTKYWTSKATGARYPTAWKAEVPSLALQLDIEAAMPEQELVLKPIAYWEGMIRISGTRAGKDIQGHGYMELTGYAGPLVGLSTPEP
jgi:predicted secreted hydrolase